MLKAFSMSISACFLLLTFLVHELHLPPSMAAKRKHPLLVKLGRQGGKKSAQARMEKLTPEQRSEIARRAAQARWSKKGAGRAHE